MSIWEEIRHIVSWKTDRLVESVHKEISNDSLLAQFRGKRPVPPPAPRNNGTARQCLGSAIVRFLLRCVYEARQDTVRRFRPCGMVLPRRTIHHGGDQFPNTRSNNGRFLEPAAVRRRFAAGRAPFANSESERVLLRCQEKGL